MAASVVVPTLDLLPGLTPSQHEAVLHTGSPLLIIAGPGSGKTEVLTWRVAHLIRSGRVDPAHCLVTTFSNKAALELKDRIQQKRPEVDVEQMPIGTIHSRCAEILRAYQADSALPRGFRILDEEEQFLFVYTHRRELGLDGKLKGRPQDYYEAVLRLFNVATEDLKSVGARRAVPLLDWCQQQLEEAKAFAAEAAKGRSKAKAKKADDAVERLVEEAQVVEAYGRYCELLQSQALVDFALLQRHALNLIKGRPKVLEDLRSQFHEILVDEYQDTSAAQEQILDLLAGDGTRLTVVGDDDQSIYRFRGATVRNIRKFQERHPAARLILLEQNFRSRNPIVKHSLDVIDHNPDRFPKKLFTERGEGSEIILAYECTVADEAQVLARYLRSLRESGAIRQWSDVAVLLRSVRSYADTYVAALSAEDIPAFVIGEETFFARPEVSQICGLFKFLSDSKKGWADKYLRCDLLGLDDAAAAALAAHKEDLRDAATDKALAAIGIENAAARAKLLRLLALKTRVLARKHESLLSVFYELLAITGCVPAYEQAGDREALMNLGSLSRIVAQFDDLGGTRSLYPFREYLYLLDARGASAAAIPPDDAVQMMTIHQAKGLEFPVVVMPSAMDGRLPSIRRRDRYEVPCALRASREPEVDDPHLVDERKLFYVGATRARDLLILGTADIVAKRGGGPSPFLHEVFGEDLHAAANVGRGRVVAAESGRPHAEPRERLSFSQLSYFLQCPMRYKLAVVYGLETQKPDVVDFGANVHRALLAIHEQARQGRSVPERDVAGLVEGTWLGSGGDGERVAEREAKRAEIRQLERYVREHGQTLAVVAAAEVRFSFALGKHVLLGKIDLIRKHGDGVEIVDFKTGDDAAKGEVEDPIDVQLDIYALGAETALGVRVVRRTAHFLKSGKIHAQPWTADAAARTRAHLNELAGLISDQRFEPRYEYCPRCTDFRSICPFGSAGP